MKPNHPHIVLYQPEIPQNTGNIGRLAAATCCRLHLVLPLGFSLSDKNLRRPGLDYWPYLDLELHPSFQYLEDNAPDLVFLSKTAEHSYLSIPTSAKYFVFGQETKGLPNHFREKYPDRFFRIPIFHDKVRSLNLANAVSIVVYDQLRKRKIDE